MTSEKIFEMIKPLFSDAISVERLYEMTEDEKAKARECAAEIEKRILEQRKNTDSPPSLSLQYELFTDSYVIRFHLIRELENLGYEVDKRFLDVTISWLQRRSTPSKKRWVENKNYLFHPTVDVDKDDDETAKVEKNVFFPFGDKTQGGIGFGSPTPNGVFGQSIFK